MKLMKNSFYNLLKVTLLVLGLFFINSCDQGAEGTAEMETEKRSSSDVQTELTNNEPKDTLKNQTDKIDSSALKSKIKDDVLRYYTNLLEQIKGEIYTLQKKGTLSFPESLSEDMEGGGIIPKVIEINSDQGVVGTILYKESKPYPMTFALSLPVKEDGFTLPITHYEIIEVNYTPVLRVMRSISGLLSEGPFEQAFYYIGGRGKSVVPIHQSKGEAMSEADENAIGEWIVHSKFPAGSYSQDCPPGLNEGKAKNLQLDFTRESVLSKTVYTGFTTDFFYYFTSDSTLTFLGLSKHMVSPDDERIEEEVNKGKQSLTWKNIRYPGAQVFKIESSSELMPSGYFCQ